MPTDPVDDYNGTLRYPRWLGDMGVKYRWRSWTYYYTLSYVGKMDSNAYTDYGGYNQAPPLDPAHSPYDFAVGSYITHSLSAKYTGANNWSITGGIRNLTDEEPKTISPGAYNRVGNALLYSGYDYFGRRAFLSVSKTF